MQRQEIKDLIKRYNAGTCSEYEKGLLEEWYLQFEITDLKALSDEDREADLVDIWNKLPANQPKIKRFASFYTVAAAVVVFIFLSVGIYYTAYRETDQEQVIKVLAQNLKPGANKAILTLSDGKQLILTGAVNGPLARQQHIAITKTAEGKIVYEPAPEGGNSRMGYNTLSTPLGGTYNLILADGTNVTLDAGSSIRYPVAFKGVERRVEITGQAYFEVAHNKARPFRVSSNGQTVEVLGTHFNINTYADEGATRTTLLEGSVKVSKAGKAVTLRPGQQSFIAFNRDAIAVKNADIENVVAWKNGTFSFKRADLPTVMRQFARWYNVEVVYEGEVPDAAITGKVLRAANAAQVLKIINNLGVRFKMDGRKIIIMKSN